MFQTLAIGLAMMSSIAFGPAPKAHGKVVKASVHSCCCTCCTDACCSNGVCTMGCCSCCAKG